MPASAHTAKPSTLSWSDYVQRGARKSTVLPAPVQSDMGYALGVAQLFSAPASRNSLICAATLWPSVDTLA
jgi:hypothetical protein